MQSKQTRQQDSTNALRPWSRHDRCVQARRRLQALPKAITRTTTLYEALPRGYIRLLTILAHTGSSAICELRSYRRPRAPPYDALSYCWGSSTATTTILCNGHNLKIRRSLLTLLGYLLQERPQPRRPLWIDAICLNQQDDEEKAIQVPSMGEIYKAARRTMVWLGEDESRTAELAFAFAKGLYPLIFKYGAEDEELSSAIIEGRQKTKPAWDALALIFGRDWFLRLWIVQETLFSKQITVMCGQHHIRWAVLIAVLDATINTDTVSTLLASAWNPDLSIDHPAYSIQFLDEARKGYMLGEGHGFSYYMDIVKSQKCGEPVDRLWAILALLPAELRRRVEVSGIIDYSPAGRRDYWKSYLQFMVLLFDWSQPRGHEAFDVRENFILRRDGRAYDFWQAILSGQGLCKSVYLPSWCPDWNAPSLYDSFTATRSFGAGQPEVLVYGYRRPELSLLPEKSLLSAAGFTIDFVRDVVVAPMSKSPGGNSDSDEAKYGRWILDCCVLVVAVLEACDKTITTFVRTLLAIDEGAGSLHGVLEEEYHALIELCGSLLNRCGLREGLPPVAVGRLYRAPFACVGRKFFNTTGGRIGLGPGELETGDLICVLHGGLPLYALRLDHGSSQQAQNTEIDEQRARPKRCFKLLGDAFIDGLMYGEAYDASDRGPDEHFMLV